jgi:hypothetical protein
MTPNQTHLFRILAWLALAIVLGALAVALDG